MFRQGATVALAPADQPALAAWCRLFFPCLGCGDTLLEILQTERQLVGIELLRPSAEAMTLQRHDDGPQPIPFTLDPSDLCRMLRALGNEQCTQRFWIRRKVVGFESHVSRCTARALERKTFPHPESTCRRLIASLVEFEPRLL